MPEDFLSRPRFEKPAPRPLGRVLLSWNSVENAEGYDIQMADTESFEAVEKAFRQVMWRSINFDTKSRAVLGDEAIGKCPTRVDINRDAHIISFKNEPCRGSLSATRAQNTYCKILTVWIAIAVYRELHSRG